MNHAISDHGELDFLNFPSLSDEDKAKAEAAKKALEENRIWRNANDRWHDMLVSDGAKA